jgi:hypothetical protein
MKRCQARAKGLSLTNSDFAENHHPHIGRGSTETPPQNQMEKV